MLECVYTLASMGGCWPLCHTLGTLVHPRLAWGILDLVRSSTVPMRFGIRVVCPCSSCGLIIYYMMHDVRATSVAVLLMLGTAHTMPSTCDAPTGSLTWSTPLLSAASGTAPLFQSLLLLLSFALLVARGRRWYTKVASGRVSIPPTDVSSPVPSRLGRRRRNVRWFVRNWRRIARALRACCRRLRSS